MGPFFVVSLAVHRAIGPLLQAAGVQGPVVFARNAFEGSVFVLLELITTIRAVNGRVVDWAGRSLMYEGCCVFTTSGVFSLLCCLLCFLRYNIFSLLLHQVYFCGDGVEEDLLHLLVLSFVSLDGDNIGTGLEGSNDVATSSTTDDEDVSP